MLWVSYTGILPSVCNGISHKVGILGWDINLYFRCNLPLYYFLWVTGFLKLPSDQRNQVISFVRQCNGVPKLYSCTKFSWPKQICNSFPGRLASSPSILWVLLFYGVTTCLLPKWQVCLSGECHLFLGSTQVLSLLRILCVCVCVRAQMHTCFPTSSVTLLSQKF